MRRFWRSAVYLYRKHCENVVIIIIFKLYKIMKLHDTRSLGGCTIPEYSNNFKIVIKSSAVFCLMLLLLTAVGRSCSIIRCLGIARVSFDFTWTWRSWRCLIRPAKSCRPRSIRSLSTTKFRPPLSRCVDMFATQRSAKVAHRAPSTSCRFPGIPCHQCAMMGWHVARYWGAGDRGLGRSLLSRWRRPLRCE